LKALPEKSSWFKKALSIEHGNNVALCLTKTFWLSSNEERSDECAHDSSLKIIPIAYPVSDYQPNKIVALRQRQQA
jgi:hypothetical protein